MQIIKDDTGAIVGFVGESGMSEHSVDMIEEAIKNGKLSDEMFVVSDEKIGAEFMNKARGLGLNVVHCLSDLEDCSPMQKEAILANCSTKILLKNYRIGKTATMKKQPKDTIENDTGIAYVDRKGQKVEILPFSPSSELPCTVIAQSGAGMSYFEQGNELSKLTIVLQSYDEDAIKEAIEKNHLLDLKNLSEEDIKKTVMFFMETVKDRVKTPNTPQIIFDEQNEYLMRMGRTLGISFFIVPSTMPEPVHFARLKKQPDYRKFEKNKRY